MSRDSAMEQYRRKMTPETYAEVRELWKAHSIAEDKRDIPGLMATLTEDCVYEIVPTGDVWKGHDGATEFYTEFLNAFPDIDFALQNIVIGPQGVFEEAQATGTHKGPWRNQPATQRRVKFGVVIFFPWDPKRKRFTGERVYNWGLDEALRD